MAYHSIVQEREDIIRKRFWKKGGDMRVQGKVRRKIKEKLHPNRWGSTSSSLGGRKRGGGKSGGDEKQAGLKNT